MSWQDYISNLLASSKIDKAAIFSSDGQSVWASSEGFKVKPQEVAVLVKGFSNPTGGTLFATGFELEGRKYVCINNEDKLIHGKDGKKGVICVKTNQAIIIGHYSDTVQPGEATVVIAKLGDYLRGLNY